MNFRASKSRFFSMIIKWAAAAAAAKSLLTLQHFCAAGGHRVFRLYSAAVWAYIISVKQTNIDSPIQLYGVPLPPPAASESRNLITTKYKLRIL